MSVAWNLRLPYLYSSAVPGREWQRLNFAALGREDSWHVREKKASGLHISLRNLPRVQSCHPTKATWENCSINVNIETVQVYPGLITTTKKSHNSSTRNFFLPDDQPTSQHVVQQCIPDLRQAYYKVHTHTHTSNLPIELYSDSTSSSTPRTLSSATREFLRPQFYLLGMGCGM